jgi:hypothetical protein
MFEVGSLRFRTSDLDTRSTGGFHAGDNNVTRVGPSGQRVEFRMPQVASTYSEFVSHCKSIGKGAAGAVA